MTGEAAVTNSVIKKQTLINVREYLRTKVPSIIEDPKTAKRTAKQPFIRVSAARKERYYPHIVIHVWTADGQMMTLVGDQIRNLIQVQLTVIANNVKDADEISDQVEEAMRQSRSWFNTYKLKRGDPYALGWTPTMVEDMERIEHQKANTYQFIYHAQ